MHEARRWGLSIPVHGLPLSEHAALVREAVDLGFTDLFTQETAGCDAFAPLAAAAAWTGSARLGTAIASVFHRGPALLAMQAATLAELAPGRFVLGIGASSRALVSAWNDLPFERPYSRVRDTLRLLRRALAGERIDETLPTFGVQGFGLERPPAIAPPIVLAALQPRMLALAGREADGVALSLVGPDDVPKLIAEVRRAAPEGATREVVMRVGVLPTSDSERARAHGRRLIAAYLNVDAYAAMYRWLGRADELAPLWQAWRAGDRRAALEAVPDALVDAVFVHGSPERCRERLEAFARAGVTTPIASLLGVEGDPRAAMRALAPGRSAS